MTTLIYEDVEFKKTLDNPMDNLLTKMKEFVEENLSLLEQGANLRLSIMHKSGLRTGKLANMEALERLLSAPGILQYWESPDKKYQFHFKNKMYVQGDKIIHLTAQEQLALFRYVILHHTANEIENWSQISYNLRMKFGQNFVEEITVC